VLGRCESRSATECRDHWLSSPKREEVFGPLGVTNIRTFVKPDDPTEVAVLMDVPDLGAFAAAMQSESAAEAMEHDGGYARDAGNPRRGINIHLADDMHQNALLCAVREREGYL
jgi:hypothetical protein